jgi:DNA-directed RNA polymerase III subunit RPC1
MRIGHEKWRGRNLKKDAGGRDGAEGKGNYTSWKASFEEAVREDKQIEAHVDKAIDDLNPLKVLNLFRRVTAADCELLGLDPTAGRPEEFVWQYISVPPVCIRPSVQQEAATCVSVFSRTPFPLPLLSPVPSSHLLLFSPSPD